MLWKLLFALYWQRKGLSRSPLNLGHYLHDEIYARVDHFVDSSTSQCEIPNAWYRALAELLRNYK